MFYCYFSNKLIVYECIILYMLWLVFFLLLLLLSNCILENVLYCNRDVIPTRCLENPTHGNLLLQGVVAF
jgi:hypothetical protein